MNFQFRIFLIALSFWSLTQEVVAQVDTTQVVLTDADWTKYAQIEVMTSKYMADKTKELKEWITAKEGLGEVLDTIKLKVFGAMPKKKWPLG